MNNIEFKSTKKALYIDGKQITKFEWDQCFINEKQNKAILTTNHKFAVYDLEIKDVIFNMLDLDQVQIHDNERIMVGKGNKDAIYSITGDKLIDFLEASIYLAGDFYLLKQGDKFGIASLNGEKITPIIYDNIVKEKSFIIVTLGKKEGIFDLDCNMILNAEFDKIGVFDKYIITVPDKKDICRRQLYTIDGLKLILDIDNVFNIADNYAGIMIETTNKRHSYSLYSFDGIPILEEYSYLDPGDEIADRAIIASKEGKMGLFDLEGKEILPCEYKDIRFGAGSSYEANLVTVKDDNDRRAIYSTKEGRFILPFGKYNCIASYKKGVCELVSEEKEHMYYLTNANKFIKADEMNITKSGKYEFRINDKWEMFEI